MVVILDAINYRRFGLKFKLMSKIMIAHFTQFTLIMEEVSRFG